MRATLSLLLASSVALTGACGEPSPRAPVLVRATAPVTTPSLADPLALVPGMSDVVMKIDVSALRKSPLFTKYRGMVRDFIVPGFADCTYDPFDDLDTITLGIPMSAGLALFVVRGLDRDKTLRCLRTSKIETRTDAIFDGELVALRNKSGNTNLMKFVDAKTAVIQGSKGPTKETLAKALQVGAPLRENKAFLAAVETLAPGAALSIVARPGSREFSERFAEKLGAPVRGFTTTVHSTDVITGHVAIEMADAATAVAIVENMRPQLAALRQFVGRYDIRSEGPMVIVDLVITEAQIKTFAEMARTMLDS